MVFTSAATNLVPGDDNGASDVFAANLVTGDVRRVSEAPGAAEPDGRSLNPAISPDGRWVSFSSDATNLVERDRDRVADVFLADLRSGAVERVSVSSRRRQQNQAVARPFTQVSDVSTNGRRVVFDSDATNLVPRDRNRDTDVFVRDVRAGTTRRVSVAVTDREATNDSFNPSLTPSGRFVAFQSFAEEIAAGDATGEDVFVRDLRLKTTSVVDVTARSARPRGRELVRQLLQRPALGDDAGVVAFTSTAANLTTGDANRAEDVFTRSMAAPRGGFLQAPPPVTRRRQRTGRLGLGGVDQRQHQPFAVQAGGVLARLRQGAGLPEGAGGTPDVAARPLQQPGLPEDDHPAGHRHGQQQPRDGAADGVCLAEQFGQAHASQRRPSTSNMSYRPARLSLRKRTARRLPWA